MSQTRGGISGLGLGGDILDQSPANVTSDEHAPIVVTEPVSLQKTELVPTSPLVVDRAKHEYGVAVEFEACPTFTGTPGVDERPTLFLDAVRVRYIP